MRFPEIWEFSVFTSEKQCELNFCFLKVSGTTDIIKDKRTGDQKKGGKNPCF
jgi:hypothetical protein